MPKKKYIVGNPHGIRPSIPILSFNDGQEFYEGEVFEPKANTTVEMIQRRVEQGFLIEATDG